ncbi:MAG: DUF3795 domain-containing protein [Desulfobacteraceae bacterium]|nr:DUF3795 domain-containing protein [Desulfobacteraceae bacterium]
MNMFNPDTYCGSYCGACSIAMYSNTGRADEFVACLGGVPEEELSCGGCKSDNIYAGCKACGIRRCAREKSVEYCIDCTDYPCKSYRTWQKAAKLLPHLNGAAASLENIKSDGVDHWLDEQRIHWSCPDCGTPFSWYATACSKCGRSLSSKAQKLSGWRKFLCRFMLPGAYRKGRAENKIV